MVYFYDENDNTTEDFTIDYLLELINEIPEQTPKMIITTVLVYERLKVELSTNSENCITGFFNNLASIPVKIYPSNTLAKLASIVAIEDGYEVFLILE